MTLSTRYPLAYGLARLQARVGDLPTAAEWTRLHSTEGLGPFLDAARRRPLRAWLIGLDTRSSSHDIERTLRHSLGWQIEELTTWLPTQWHPAVRWLELLPYLGIFAYLSERGEVYPWMREDMVLFQLLSSSQGDPPGCNRAPGFEALPGTWRAGWLQRLPDAGWRKRAARERIGLALLRAAGLSDEEDRDDPWQPQKNLQSQLLRLFHRHGANPLAAFAYGGLLLLESRLLRAELQRRQLFPVQEAVS